MIQVQDLHKKYESLQAVDGISFDVQEGELFGFLGPNGAGKTTTLSMICGLLRPDSGNVYLNGIDVWQNPKEAKRSLGLVPQDVALYEEFSSRENLRFWGGLYDISSKQLSSRIDQVLDWVGLADRSKESVAKFSGGMKRRLNIAIGLVHNPKVILLDEPTVGIDPQSRNAILDLIREITRSGTTVLFTTHHLEEAQALCERIAIMDHGKILECGSLDELINVVGGEEMVTVQGGFTSAEIHSLIHSQPVTPISIADSKATLVFQNQQINCLP